MVGMNELEFTRIRWVNLEHSVRERSRVIQESAPTEV